VAKLNHSKSIYSHHTISNVLMTRSCFFEPWPDTPGGSKDRLEVLN